MLIRKIGCPEFQSFVCVFQCLHSERQKMEPINVLRLLSKREWVRNLINPQKWTHDLKFHVKISEFLLRCLSVAIPNLPGT